MKARDILLEAGSIAKSAGWLLGAAGWLASAWLRFGLEEESADASIAVQLLKRALRYHGKSAMD